MKKKGIVEELLESGPLTAESVTGFLEEHTFPYPEGRDVTFAFRGEADEVFVHHWIHGLPSTFPLHRLDGTDLWVERIELPRNSRVEYKLEIVRDGHRELVQDPINPHLARDPFGANSVCHATGYDTPEWTLPQEDVETGELEEHALQSKVFQDERRVSVYVPPRINPRRRYRLLLVHDGFDFVEYSGLKVILDNLIHRLEIPPLIVALTQSPDRLVEYGANPDHALFLRNELVPFLEKTYPIQDTPSGRCLLGASFGGVASFHAAWSYPGFYGGLFLQSGSFAFSDIGGNKRGPEFEPVVQFMNSYRRHPIRISDRMFLTCGQYESLIFENRSLVPLLQETGATVRFVEARDGHNWENWRDRLREGLSWLFPGPLWMVYE